MHAKTCLDARDAQTKAELTLTYAKHWLSQSPLVLPTEELPPEAIYLPGYPPQLQLVPPRALPKRKLHSINGLATLTHAIAHIEFNAINIAWDAVYRFRDMPSGFYTDWIKVAADEARHFLMLSAYLNQLGYQYGDFPAHNGLWEMCEETAHDVLSRMALVPRLLEARGLDVTPQIQARLRQEGETELVSILDEIYQDEIEHVKTGNHWFAYCCNCRSLDPLNTFKQLLQQHIRANIKGPLNKTARYQAGFVAAEIKLLESFIRY